MANTDNSFMPIRFNKENYFPSKSIAGRGQFAISYIVGKLEITDKSIIVDHPYINTPVLFKSASQNDDEQCLKALIRELNILESLKHHPNILNLVGLCINELKNREIYLAFELCVHGNLLKFLRHCDPLVEYDNFRPIVTHTEGGPVLTLTRCRLLQWSYDIAYGMEYLASKRIAHNDLAARNVLVTDQWTMKICNFALSQIVPSRSPCHNLQKDVLPLKWMSPETIKRLQYSELSDVWSFGITLWEILTIGEIPYRDRIIDKDFYKDLLRGVRLAKPIYASSEMWNIMCSCWEYSPERRPKFFKLRILIHNLVNSERPDASNTDRKNRKVNMNTLTGI